MYNIEDILFKPDTQVRFIMYTTTDPDVASGVLESAKYLLEKSPLITKKIGVTGIDFDIKLTDIQIEQISDTYNIVGIGKIKGIESQKYGDYTQEFEEFKHKANELKKYRNKYLGDFIANRHREDPDKYLWKHKEITLEDLVQKEELITTKEYRDRLYDILSNHQGSKEDLERRLREAGYIDK